MTIGSVGIKTTRKTGALGEWEIRLVKAGACPDLGHMKSLDFIIREIENYWRG